MNSLKKKENSNKKSTKPKKRAYNTQGKQNIQRKNKLSNP
jgi:hypothetical protein